MDGILSSTSIYRRNRKVAQGTVDSISGSPYWPYGSDMLSLFASQLLCGVGSQTQINEGLSCWRARETAAGRGGEELIPGDCRMVFDLQAEACGEEQMMQIRVPNPNIPDAAFLEMSNLTYRVLHTPYLT